MSDARQSPRTPPERRVPGLSPSLRSWARLLFRMLTLLSPALAARYAARVFVHPRARPATEAERRFLRTSRPHRLASPHGAVQVYEWPAAGPSVLVVHGWISHAGRMQTLIEALHAEGLRIIAFDAPAHGRSAGRHADLQRFVAALVAVSREFGPIAGVLAHSMGAMAAITWLAEDSSAADVLAAVFVGMPRDVGYLLDSFVATLQLRADIRERLRGLFHVRYGRTPEQFSARDLAQTIRVPVLLVHGTQDDLVPLEHAHENLVGLRDGQLHVADGLNHSAPLRDPATVALMVRFLSERLKSSAARTALAH
jgi:alpha-beta hydrolase superfamily lysophospholipase